MRHAQLVEIHPPFDLSLSLKILVSMLSERPIKQASVILVKIVYKKPYKNL